MIGSFLSYLSDHPQGSRHIKPTQPKKQVLGFSEWFLDMVDALISIRSGRPTVFPFQCFDSESLCVQARSDHDCRQIDICHFGRCLEWLQRTGIERFRWNSRRRRQRCLSQGGTRGGKYTCFR